MTNAARGTVYRRVGAAAAAAFVALLLSGSLAMSTLPRRRHDPPLTE